MKIAQTVAEILDSHVTLEVECIDRMYLNLYVPGLQHVNGAVGFFRYHRKQAVASTALMRPISEKFVSAIESFIEDHQIPVVEFGKGERKDDIAKQRMAQFNRRKGSSSLAKLRKRRRCFGPKNGPMVELAKPSIVSTASRCSAFRPAR